MTKKKIFILEDQLHHFNSIKEALEGDFYCSSVTMVEKEINSLYSDEKRSSNLLTYDYFIIDVHLDLTDDDDISGIKFIEDNLTSILNNSEKIIIIFTIHRKDYLINKYKNIKKLLNNSNILFVRKKTDRFDNISKLFIKELINKIEQNEI